MRPKNILTRSLVAAACVMATGTAFAQAPVAIGTAPAVVGAYPAVAAYPVAGETVVDGGVYGAAGVYGDAYASGPYYGVRPVQPLFENYFTQGYANRADAALYISPVGVPGWVGHTYITNQAFYPHEFTYAHKDRYHSYYDNGFGMNRTSAHYYSPPVRTGVKGVVRQLSLPRY